MAIAVFAYKLNSAAYQLNDAAHSLSEFNTKQTFINRGLNFYDDFFYRIYQPAALSAGRCVLYMVDIPDKVFSNYLYKDENPVLVKEDIVDIENVVSKIPADYPNRYQVEKNLYMDYDICMDLNADEAFSMVKPDERNKRAVKIRGDLPRRYSLFAERYVAYLDFRDYALARLYDYEEVSMLSETEQVEKERETQLRNRENRYIRMKFLQNLCDPANRSARFLAKIENIDKEYYDKSIRKNYPRLTKFLDSPECRIVRESVGFP